MNKVIIVLIAYLQVACCLQTTQKTTTSIKTSTERSPVDKNTKPTTTEFTTVFTTTCEFSNGSCSSDTNTTVETNATTLLTTPTPKNSSKILTKVPSMGKANSGPKKDFLQKRTYYDSKDLCICNLQLDYCDLNCCCDPDCSYENKLVFDHCEPEFRNYDTRFCDYMEYIYINNTGHEWEVNQNGLFCIVRSNLPPTYTIQRKHPLKNIAEVAFQRSHKYSWPTISEFPDVFETGKNYTYGSEIWFLRNGSLNKFWFYKNFITNHCTIKENLMYLMDVDQNCAIDHVGENNTLLHPEHYFKNILVISDPSSFNMTKYKQGCPKNVCIEIEPQICTNNFEQCKTVPKNVTVSQTVCKCNSTNYSCINVVRGYFYTFQHNGTRGIKNVKVKLILSNVTYDFCDGPFEMLQHTRVEFVWFNHTLNYSSHLSGNPGYLSGKPILIANLITEHTPINSTKSSLTNKNTNYTVRSKLYRNPLYFPDNFMTLPMNVEGKCLHDRQHYLPIEFGYNLHSTCDLEEVLKDNKNYTAKLICQKIQSVVFKYWNLNPTNNSLNNIFVGQFGNANAYRIEEWSHLLFKQDLNDVLNNVWGDFSKDNQTVECGNITTGISIEFFNSRIDFEKIINQEKLLGSTIEFQNFMNMSFSYKMQEFVYNLKITSKVMFFDITQKKITKIVDPPTFRIRLPHDFFYPFVKIDNKAYTVKSLIHIVVFCTFVMIF